MYYIALIFAHIMSIETHTVYAALYSLVFGVWNRCLCMRMSYFLWACEEWMSWATPLLEPSASLRQMRYVKHNIYYCICLYRRIHVGSSILHRSRWSINYVY